MTRVRVEGFPISLDGYGAGPNQDIRNPLGVGGQICTSTAIEGPLGKSWYRKGKRHREDGPAVEHADGRKGDHPIVVPTMATCMFRNDPGLRILPEGNKRAQVVVDLLKN